MRWLGLGGREGGRDGGEVIPSKVVGMMKSHALLYDITFPVMSWQKYLSSHRSEEISLSNKDHPISCS